MRWELPAAALNTFKLPAQRECPGSPSYTQETDQCASDQITLASPRQMCQKDTQNVIVVLVFRQPRVLRGALTRGKTMNLLALLGRVCETCSWRRLFLGEAKNKGNYSDFAIGRAKTFRSYFNEGAIECMVCRGQTLAFAVPEANCEKLLDAYLAELARIHAPVVEFGVWPIKAPQSLAVVIDDDQTSKWKTLLTTTYERLQRGEEPVADKSHESAS
jgi:hypothetical protein